MKALAESSIPAQVHPAYDAITALTDLFCQAHLTDEYQLMCRRLATVLAQKCPMPLVRGKPEVWACAIVRVVGRVNFLDVDTGTQPFMKLTVIDRRFGVSSATGQSKSKAIRDMLQIRSFDLDWTLPSLRDRGVSRRWLSFSPEFFDILDREAVDLEQSDGSASNCQPLGDGIRFGENSNPLP